MQEALQKLYQPTEPITHEINDDECVGEHVEEVLSYLDQMTDEEKAKSKRMAQEYVAEHGHNTPTEILRVIKILQDPAERDLERSERWVLRRYLDELVIARRAL